MSRDPLGFLSRLYCAHGDLAPFQLGPQKGVLAVDPVTVDAVLRTQHGCYTRLTRVYESMRDALGNGILVSEGPEWKKHRRIVNPVFHRRRIEGFSRTVAQIAGETVETWRDGQVVDLEEVFTRVTLRIVCETLFGDVSADETRGLARALDACQRHVERDISGLSLIPMLGSLPTPSRKRYASAIRALHRITTRIIERRRGGLVDGTKSADDIVSMLLQAQDDHGEPLPLAQVRAESLTILSAGHETTANALAWAFYELCMNPKVLSRLRKEVEAALGNRPLSMNEIAKVPFARCVFDEVLRLHPPAWATGRVVIEAHELAGRSMRAGELVLISPYVVQRRPDLFPDPERFRPERWEGNGPKSLHPFAFFPFGGGPRKCVGEAFAYMEALTLIIEVTRHFSMSTLPDRPVVARPQVTLGFVQGMWVRLRALP